MILSTHGIVGSQITQFVGLLDLYPNASAAYSLRKLRSAYTGSAIRVRRESDNTEQDIGFIDNVLDTATLTSFCSGTNGFVKTWYDQSGNARNAEQTTAADQPKIATAGSVNIEGVKPALTFDNTDGLLLNVVQEINLSNFTILWVAKRFSTNNNGMILTGSDGSQFMGNDINGGGNPYVNCQTGILINIANSNTSASNIETTYHLAYANRRNSTESVGQFNNSNNNYNNITSSATVNIRRISKYVGGSTTFDYVGNIQEIIIYASDKSSNRTEISSNINDFYSIY